MFFNSLDRRWKRCEFPLDLGLEIFDAGNIDIVMTENAESPFNAIILIASLISLQWKFIEQGLVKRATSLEDFIKKNKFPTFKSANTKSQSTSREECREMGLCY